MKNERDIPGIPQLQLQRKQKMVKRLEAKSPVRRAPVMLASGESCIPRHDLSKARGRDQTATCITVHDRPGLNHWTEN
jgi:hypothetical protein